MQLIKKMPVDAEKYVAENFQQQIRPPPECPNCGSHGSLWALCYYFRNLSRLVLRGTLRVSVRRFRCRQCRRTLSILPSFALPYRLIQSATVDEYFRGSAEAGASTRWLPLLRSYWIRFLEWIPEIDRVLGRTLGHHPLYGDGARWHASITAVYGNVEACTRQIVRLFRITLLGRYRCHQPYRPRGDP